MTDSRLRELERRYQQTRVAEDEANYFAEAVRAGFVKTGFLKLGNSGSIYLGGAAQSMSLTALVPRWVTTGGSWTGALHDVEFGEDRLHVLVGGEDGLRVRSIDVDGRVETRIVDVSVPDGMQVNSLISVDGKLGYVATASVDLCDVVLLGGNRRLRMQGTVYGYVPTKGFLASVYNERSRTSQLHLYGDDKGRVLSKKEVSGVYVQDKTICCMYRVVGRVGKERQVMQERDGLILPSYSRLLTGVRLARPDGFGRYYNSRSKTLLEVPERNLEGLLVALRTRGI